MAKAELSLTNGTKVQIEGTVAEVQALLAHYASSGTPNRDSHSVKDAQSTRTKRRTSIANAKTASVDLKERDGKLDLAKIINLAKSCDEAEAIETQILDRASQVDRALLPLYVVHEHLDNKFALSSGEVSKITTDLGVPVSQPNASRTLAGAAAKYVIGDKIRKKGQAVRYKLSRRGIQYMKAVIGGKSDENAD